jgi:hypothetical protein
MKILYQNIITSKSIIEDTVKEESISAYIQKSVEISVVYS